MPAPHRPTSPTSPLGAMASRPLAAGRLVAAVIAQCSQGAAPLVIVVFAHQARMSLLVPALTLSAVAVGAGVGRPIQGRALDRLPIPAVLRVIGILHAAAFIGLAVAAGHRLPVAFVALGWACGLTLPPIATAMRAALPRTEDAAALQRSMAVIAIVQAAGLVTGPAVFSVVAKGLSPLAAVVVFALTVAAATAAFSVQAGGASRRASGAAAAAVPLRNYRLPLLGVAGLGIMLGSLEFAAPSLGVLSAGRGRAGELAVALTVGTFIGGLLVVTAWSRASTGRLLTYGLILQMVGASCLVLALPTAFDALPLAVAGSGFIPALAAMSAVLARLSGGTAEAFGWQSAAVGAGSAVAGPSLALLADQFSLRSALLMPAVVSVLVLVVVSVGLRRPARPVEPGQPAVERTAAT